MVRVKNEIAVGLMFIVAMAVLGYYTIIMKEDWFSSRKFQIINVEFSSVFGLKVDDNVKVFGVDSGKVKDIVLGEGKVIVKLKIYRKFKLYENYEVKIRAEGFLTGKCVSIIPGYSFKDGKTYAQLDLDEPIKGIASGDLMALLEDVVSENRENIKVSIANLRSITDTFKSISDKIDRGDGTLGKLINDDSVHQNADDLITELRESIEDAREQAPITSFIRAALTAL